MGPSRSSRSSGRSPLVGPPPALPELLDRLAEAWWSARPRTRWAVTLVLVALVAVALTARATASPWGPSATVLVAERDLPVGHELQPDDLREQRRPLRVVPDDAIEVAGGTMVVGAVAGAPVTTSHVDNDGLAAGLDGDRAAVPVPVDEVAPVPVGATVDLVGGDVSGSGAALAQDAIVLADDGTHLWLEVEREASAEVAAAAAAGRLAIVLAPS